MGFSAQAGQVILRTQGAQGVLAPDLATKGVAIKLRSGSLGPTRDLLIPDPEIGGGRDVTDAYLGAVSFGGDYEFYARMDSIATLLAAVLGETTTAIDTPSAGANQHTIEGWDGAQLPFLSVEEAIGANMEVFDYTDAVVNTFHLEADANGYLMGTVGLIAARQVAGGVRTDAVANDLWDNTPMIVGTNITITYNGVSVPAKSFSIDINNNFESDDYRLGSFFIGDLTPKRREITASFTIRESSSALWRQAVYGVPGATQPGGIPTKNQLVITMQTYEFISGTSVPFSLGLTVPKYTLKPYSLAVSGDDIIEDSIEGQALRPDPAQKVMTAVIVNDLAEVA